MCDGDVEARAPLPGEIIVSHGERQRGRRNAHPCREHKPRRLGRWECRILPRRAGGRALSPEHSRLRQVESADQFRSWEEPHGNAGEGIGRRRVAHTRHGFERIAHPRLQGVAIGADRAARNHVAVEPVEIHPVADSKGNLRRDPDSTATRDSRTGVHNRHRAPIGGRLSDFRSGPYRLPLIGRVAVPADFRADNRLAQLQRHVERPPFFREEGGEIPAVRQIDHDICMGEVVEPAKFDGADFGILDGVRPVDQPGDTLHDVPRPSGLTVRIIDFSMPPASLDESVEAGEGRGRRHDAEGRDSRVGDERFKPGMIACPIGVLAKVILPAMEQQLGLFASEYPTPFQVRRNLGIPQDMIDRTAGCGQGAEREGRAVEVLPDVERREVRAKRFQES